MNRLRLVVRRHDRQRAPRGDRWAEYEAGKRDIADTAQSAEEYERRLRELAERLEV